MSSHSDWDAMNREMLDRQRRLSSLPGLKALEWTFGNADMSLRHMQVAKLYADSWDELSLQSQGLLFFGPVGVGKSYAAACIANALLDRRIPVKMLSFATVLSDLRGLYGDKLQQYMDSIAKCRLLILDDLGVERETAYAKEQLQHFIDDRWLSRQPLIVTTNLSPADMQESIDLTQQRLYDRLNNMCTPVFCGEVNLRAQDSRRRHRELKAWFDGQTAELHTHSKQEGA